MFRFGNGHNHANFSPSNTSNSNNSPNMVSTSPYNINIIDTSPSDNNNDNPNPYNNQFLEEKNKKIYLKLLHKIIGDNLQAKIDAHLDELQYSESK